MPRKCLVEKEERCNPVRLERKQGERQKYIFYFYSLFVGNVICFILNGYRKRAVCRKHKVEAGNWSFDPNQGSCNQPFSILISSQLFIPIYKYPKHIFEYKYILSISKFLDSKRKIPWNFFGILISFQALHKPLTVTTENTFDHNDHHRH